MVTDERVVAAIERLMVEAIGITTVALAEASPGVELTFPQWRALVIVGEARGIRVGEIARRVGSTVPTASRLVRRLERRGFVSAVRDEADRRATIVALTQHGAALRTALVGRRRELVRAALASLPGGVSADLLEGLAEIESALRVYG